MMNKLTLDRSTYVIKSPPGDTLLSVLEARHITQAELALRTGRPLKTINEIIKGKASITPETALQFERVLGVSATFWLNREQQYRESQARHAQRQKLQKQLDWLLGFPLEQMVEMGWLHQGEGAVEQMEGLLNYFGIADVDGWPNYWTVSIPGIIHSPSFQRSPGSVTAWLRQGELKAQESRCQDYQARALRELTRYLSDLVTSPFDTLYPDLIQMLARTGVVLCVTPELSGNRIRGVIRWLTSNRALVQLSTSHSRLDVFWHALFHSLGHILLHGKRQTFLEEDGLPITKEEADADQFIKNLLGETEFSSYKIEWQHLLQVSQTVEDEADAPTDMDAADEIEAGNKPSTQPITPDALALRGWPGLSVGARRVLLSAGFADEAGRVDEKLFSAWVNEQIAEIKDASELGYTRDALTNLNNLIAIVQIGAQVSPALDSLSQTLNLLKLLVEKTAQNATDIRSQLRDLIRETYQPLTERMVAETRKNYSAVATKTESSFVERLFQQDVIIGQPHE